MKQLWLNDKSYQRCKDFVFCVVRVKAKEGFLLDLISVSQVEVTTFCSSCS